MDETGYAHSQRAHHAAKTSSLLAGGITAVVTFVVFGLVTGEIQMTVHWMIGLTMMAGSATYVITSLIAASQLKRGAAGA